jgi:hypothetical protein
MIDSIHWCTPKPAGPSGTAHRGISAGFQVRRRVADCGLTVL